MKVKKTSGSGNGASNLGDATTQAPFDVQTDGPNYAYDYSPAALEPDTEPPHNTRNPLEKASAAMAQRDTETRLTETDLQDDDLGMPYQMQSDQSLGALATTEQGVAIESASDTGPTPQDDTPLFAPRAVAGLTRQKSTAKRATVSLKVYLFALLASALWIGGLLAFAVGFQSRVGAFAFEPFTTSVFGFLALAPVGFIGFCAFAFNQGARFAREAERAKGLADDLASPVTSAAVAAGSAVATIRSEINGATDAATRARIELTALREGLAEETRRLLEAANESIRTTQHLTQVMGEEREALGRVTSALDHQADSVVSSVERQARMVAEASDLAETQLREAEASLAARAADLTAAAEDANRATQAAGQGLEVQIERLETASRTVHDRMSDADAGMDRQRVMLSATVDSLKAEQEQFEQTFAERHDQLAILVSQSIEAANAVTQSVADANQQFDDLAGTTIDRTEAMSDAARQHRAAIASAAVDSLSALTDASLRHRDVLVAETQYMIDTMVQAAEEARLAAEDQMAHVKGQIDQLGEASFTAGQQAEAMFEARLSEARTLIEQSARLAEEAGARSSEQLTEGLVSTRAVVSEFAELLARLEARMANLPKEAARQAEIVTSGLAQGLIQGIEDLTLAARRAAEDSQTFDVEFKDRVRRNYEALGLAVMQLEAMGKRTPSLVTAQTAERPPLTASSSLRQPVAGRSVLRTPPASPTRPDPTTRPLVQPSDSQPRPRLRLTPAIETPPAPTSAPTAEPARPVTPVNLGSGTEKSDQWTWKDLLTSLEEDFVEDEQLGPILAQEIHDMKIDTQSLLPRVSVEEIAASINAGDYNVAFDKVTGLAQNSIRRLAKRLQSDRGLMTKAERFVEIQSNMIVDAASRDREGFLMPTLLSNEQGRAYLLYAAALADTQ
jgi:hypothetical protein